MAFDYIKAIDELRNNSFFKEGLKYYIESNNLKPKNGKEFLKIIEDYKGITL